MEHTKEENNQTKEKLKSLKTKAKTPLERAEERLRKTRLDDDSNLPTQETISPPQQTQPKPSPQPKSIEEIELPKSTELPSPEQVSPRPLPEKEKVSVAPIKISEQKAREELEQALEEKSIPEKTLIEPKKQAPKPSYKKEVEVPPREEPLEEKVEFLKREGVKTMQKDLKRAREFEAKKERQRITDLQTEPKKTEVEKQTESKLVEKKPTIQPLPKKDLIPQPPERPSSFKKIVIRIGVFVIIALVIIFIYWFFAQKEQSAGGDVTPSTSQEIPQGQEVVGEVEITTPQSIISVADILTFNAITTEDIENIYNQIITQVLTENEFVRVIIKNEKEKRLFNLNEIAQTFQITIPTEVLENLKIDAFNLLVYPQEHGKRGVVIAEIKDKEKLILSLTNWEADIIADGLQISGNKIPTLSTKFKDYSFDNVPFRFLTLSKSDLGLCYVLSGDYFAISSSFKSMEETIKAFKEQVVIDELKDKAGQLFIIGFEGKTLTSKFEEFFKKYKPGGVLLLSENIENSEQLKVLINDLQSLSKKETGFPLLIAVDQEGGLISRLGFLEEKTAQSEISDQNHAYTVGLKRGGELKELGVNLNLAPVLDSAQNDDFLFERSFQKSTDLSGQLAKFLIQGQKDTGVFSAMKHFPGYVDIDFNPEEKLATTSLPEISQFQKALEADPEMVMVSNVIYQDIDPSLPFTFSSTSIQFLKNKLGSEILIISDDLSQNSLLNNFSLNEIVTNPLLAGVDIMIFSGWRSSVKEGLDAFFKAIEQKEISDQLITNAFLRINQLKQDLK
jgi:beta-N-acetylhexosaminidase